MINLIFQSWILCFLVILFIITITNSLLIKKLKVKNTLYNYPKVSILVPARNEEKNIEACVSSLLKQEYNNFEVIVLNDNSEDMTGEILNRLQKSNKNLKVIQGKPLPEGWYGKQWACHQLYLEASSPIILFTDADTIHKKTMLKASVESLIEEDIDILSAFVKQDVVTMGEKLTVPFPIWSIFAILPLIIGYKFKNRAFIAINGQFMMLKKSSYELIGGHTAVRNNAVDDIAIGKQIKKHGLKWRIHDGTSQVSCRMYRSFSEAFDGFTKNYFAIFEYKIIPSILVWLLIIVITYQPIIQLVVNYKDLLSISSIIAIISSLINFIIWLFTVIKFKLPLKIAFFYPIIMPLASIIGFRSIIFTTLKITNWKGRTLIPPKIKWF